VIRRNERKQNPSIDSTDIISLVLCAGFFVTLFRLVLDTLDACTDGILVAEVSSLERRKGTLLGDGFHVIVEFVHEGGSGGDVQVADLALIDSVQVLHQSPQAVSVGGNEDGLSGFEFGDNVGFPVRNDAVKSRCEGFGKVFRPVGIGVPFIVGWVVLAGLVDGRWGDIVAATPDQDLVLSVLVDGLLLVETLKATVVTFVDLPRLGDRNPHAVRLFEDVPKGSDGTLLQRRKGNVGLDAGLLDELSTVGGLDVTGLAQWAIVPPGELVGEVPRRFSVTDEDERVLVSLLGSGEAVYVICVIYDVQQNNGERRHYNITYNAFSCVE
jgi:hypothetical protein